MNIYNHYTIYKITNTINNKVYIGQTTRTLKERIKGHHCKARNEKIQTKNLAPFHRAIRKYGLEKFKIEAICSCFDLDELNSRETFFILENRSNQKEFGYNCNTGGNNYASNEETKQKIGNSLKGKPSKRKGIPSGMKGKTYEEIMGEEAAKNFIENNKCGEKNPNYGKHWSDEWKAEQSKMKTGNQVL
jgi:group I intron endonuclease